MFMTRFIYQLNKFLAAVAVLASLSAFDVMAQSSVQLVNRDGTPVPGGVSTDSRLKSLKSDLYPGIYLGNGQVMRREKSAVTLFTDRASLQSLDVAAFAKGSIEMVTIELSTTSDLGGHIDLSPFNDFANLKYVHIRASMPTSHDTLFSMLKNIGTQYKLLLNVDPVN